MTHDEKVQQLLALADTLYPDEVDVFEDELARRLGFERHPSLSYEQWRRQRVALLHGAGRRADAEARTLEAQLLSDVPRQRPD